MSNDGLGACLITYNANVYYLSQRVFRGYIFVPAVGDIHYFVIRPTELKGDNVTNIRKPEQIPGLLSEQGVEMPKVLGLECDDLSYSEISRLMKCFPEAEVRNASSVMKVCRMVKTPYEVQLIAADGVCQANVYHQVARLYQEEMTDIEFQIAIESVLRREGSLGFYRTSGNLMEINMGSVLNGDNADTPTPYDFAVGGGGADNSLPVGADGHIMHRGTTVMIDMNGNFNGYQSDMTRVWRLGEVSEKAVKAHEVSRKILRRLETAALPGVAVADLYHIAMDIVKENDLEDYFMGHRQKAAFIGHGVGIQLNELPVVTPRSKDTLQENMVIALEPKFVIPGTGAVGVENTYVVTPSGLKALTIFPEEMTDLLQ